MSWALMLVSHITLSWMRIRPLVHSLMLEFIGPIVLETRGLRSINFLFDSAVPFFLPARDGVQSGGQETDRKHLSSSVSVMDGTHVVGTSLSRQTVAKTLSNIRLRTEIPSPTAVPSIANSLQCRMKSPQAIGVETVKRGASGFGRLSSITRRKTWRSFSESDCPPYPRTFFRPGGPRILHVLP